MYGIVTLWCTPYCVVYHVIGIAQFGSACKWCILQFSKAQLFWRRFRMYTIFHKQRVNERPLLIFLLRHKCLCLTYAGDGSTPRLCKTGLSSSFLHPERFQVRAVFQGCRGLHGERKQAEGMKIWEILLVINEFCLISLNVNCLLLIYLLLSRLVLCTVWNGCTETSFYGPT